MREVVLEVKTTEGWEVVGGVSEVEPPGSFTSRSGDAREVYMFGFYEGGPGVWLSVGGWDTNNDAVREVHSLGWDRVSDLAEPFRMPVIGPRGRYEIRVKVTS